MNRRLLMAFLVVVLLGVVVISYSSAATGDPVLINELLASHSGTDDTEFVELYGLPGQSLYGLSLIVVEGDSFDPGIIDRRFDFKSIHEIGPNGFFLFGNCAGLPANYGEIPDAKLFTDYLENSSLTVALVETDSLVSDQGDYVTELEVVRDAVALTDGDAGDTFYFGAPVLGPDGNFFPAGGRRIADGVDTGAAADWVLASFSLPGANTPTGGGFDGCAPLPLTIPEIQGNERYSPYQGDVVVTSGVVTLISANGRDMWLQDPVGDGDLATSDGIFVDDRDWLSPQPEIGDSIVITATVEEQQFGNALPLTRLNGPSGSEIISSGNPLPVPVELINLPIEYMADGEAFWEPLEGMLVMVDNAPVVAPTNGFGEFGMLAKTDAVPRSGFFPQTQQILIRGLGGDKVDYNPERIMVDDSSIEEAIVVMPGDRVRSLVGVVDYTFSMYKLQPAEWDVKTHNAPKIPASKRSGPKGDLVITTYNVENLFDLVVSNPNVDALGQVGFDPGSYWGPPNTQNNTIRRQPGVCQGDMNPDDAFDPALEWDGFGNNNFDDLGTHTVTCGSSSDLFISEYVEGSSNNKAVEIYNGTGQTVDLAAQGYSIVIYFNGNTSPGTTIQLTGSLADGDVYVVADDGADPAILAVADQTSTSSFFNGDDAVILRRLVKDDASSTPTPEALETQLTKLAMSIAIELGLPEILVVQEVENTSILQELGDRVNDGYGTDYQACSFETSDARGIEVGFLWDTHRVTNLECYQMSGPGVEEWYGPGSPSPGREPLVGEFDYEGKLINIVGNHFKSKGGDDPLYGVNWPANRVTEVQRHCQAWVVSDFVSSNYSEDDLVMVAGDLNDFEFAEPGELDEAVECAEGVEVTNHTVGVLEDGDMPLYNLVTVEKPAELYSFVFDGNSQVLDHILVNQALLEYFAGIDILHFNAGYPADYGEDTSTTLHSSDHDPVEARFKFVP